MTCYLHIKNKKIYLQTFIFIVKNNHFAFSRRIRFFRSLMIFSGLLFSRLLLIVFPSHLCASLSYSTTTRSTFKLTIVLFYYMLHQHAVRVSFRKTFQVLTPTTKTISRTFYKVDILTSFSSAFNCIVYVFPQTISLPLWHTHKTFVSNASVFRKAVWLLQLLFLTLT